MAETTRSIEVAKRCSAYFNCIFTGYSKKYAYLIEKANFKFIHLEPALNEEDIIQIMKVDQMKGIKHPFTYNHLKKRIENEKSIIKEYRPVVIVIGTTLSMFISARACQTHLVYIKPLAYTRTFFLKGHLELPPIFNHFTSLKTFSMKLYKKIALSITYKPRAFTKLAKEEGITLPKYTIDALDADYNLITTIPELSGVTELPTNYKYIGPVYAKLDIPIPSFLSKLPSNRPIIYFAMGSSGSKKDIIKILHILKQLSVTVICPMKKVLGSSINTFNNITNIILCDLLPSHKLGNIIDLSIIHGGEGTVQTACLSGKPFIGIGLQQEQRININECVLFGNALELKRKNIKTKELEKMIAFSLANKEMHMKAKEIQNIFEHIDGPKNAAKFLLDSF